MISFKKIESFFLCLSNTENYQNVQHIFKNQERRNLGKLVADVAEILVVKFGYPYRGSNDKDLLFAVCRDFSKSMGKFELALYYLTTVATDRYPKGTEGTQPLRWIRAVQEAAIENEITLEQRDAFIESVKEFYDLNKEHIN